MNKSDCNKLLAWCEAYWPDLFWEAGPHELGGNWITGCYKGTSFVAISIIDGEEFHSYPYFCEILFQDEEEPLVFRTFKELKDYYEQNPKAHTPAVQQGPSKVGLDRTLW